jgi:hypothetical protein
LDACVVVDPAKVDAPMVDTTPLDGEPDAVSSATTDASWLGGTGSATGGLATGSVTGGVLAGTGSATGGVLAGTGSATGGVLAGTGSITGGVLAGTGSVTGAVLATGGALAGALTDGETTGPPAARAAPAAIMRPSKKALVAMRTRGPSDLANGDSLVVPSTMIIS